MAYLNIIFPKINETWGHISYGVTTNVYRHETYYSVENYPKSYLIGRRENEYRDTILILEVGKKGL